MSALIRIIKYLIAIFFLIPLATFIGTLFILPIVLFLHTTSLVFFLGSVVVASIIWVQREFLFDAFEHVGGFLVDDQPFWKRKTEEPRKLREVRSPKLTSSNINNSKNVQSRNATKVATSRKGEIDPKRLNDRNYVLFLVRRNPDHLRLVPDSFKSDKTIVLAAVNGKPDSVKHAGESLRVDHTFVKACFERCASETVYKMLIEELRPVNPPSYRSSVLNSLDSKIKSFWNNHKDEWIKSNPKLVDDEEFVLKVLARGLFKSQDYGFVSERLRNKKEIVLAVLNHALIAIPESLENDEDVRLAEKNCVLSHILNRFLVPRSGFEIPETLKNDPDILNAIKKSDENSNYDSIW